MAKSIAFVTLLLSVVAGIANASPRKSSEYCPLKCVKNGVTYENIMCLYQSNAEGSKCKETLRTGLTEQEKQDILNLHNSLRRRVAAGQESRGLRNKPQPGSSRMNDLKWNGELADVAQRWANQCEFEHICSKIKKYDDLGVGQNIAWSGSTSKSAQFSVKQMVQGWYNEVDRFDSSRLRSFATTTLDDIYRHYAPNKVFKKKHEVYEDPEPEGDIQEFEGELMPAPISQGKMGRPGFDPMMTSSTGYGYSNFGPPGPQPYGPPPAYGPPPMSPHDFSPTIQEQHIWLPGSHDDDDEDYHEVHHSKGKGHELTIKDFFEIALTALAFLAFGLFIIQLLMNITNPMTMTTTAAAAVVDQRFKRHAFDTPTLSYSGNEELNELAHRVLRSIEAVLVAQNDDGNCLRRLLCEDNRYSRETEGGRRIWIPVWSLGMSWTSGRVLNRKPWSAMLDSVKASVLGLGHADCASLYPDCQLGRQRVKRRRRRRK